MPPSSSYSGVGEEMDNRYPKKSRLDEKDMVILQMLKNGNPSIEEMAKAILVRSTSTIHARLEYMEHEGLIVQPSKRQARSRQLTSAGVAKLKEIGLLR
jgi:predicted transcriptional regulator